MDEEHKLRQEIESLKTDLKDPKKCMVRMDPTPEQRIYLLRTYRDQLQNRLTPPPPKHALLDDTRWIKNIEASRMLLNACENMEHGKYKTLGTCKTMISKLCESGKFITNGKKGRDLRISTDSVNAMILRLRDEDLDFADIDHDE